MNTVEEIQWKSVPTEFGQYEVSDLGDVRRIDGKYLRPWLSMGYPYVGLWNQGTQVKIAVHRLVALAFVPNSNNFEQVNHIDGVKTHNMAWNLEWCSPQQNVDHACDTGLIERKLTPDDIAEIKALRTRRPLMGMKAVAKLFGIHRSMVIWIWRNDDY